MMSNRVIALVILLFAADFSFAASPDTRPITRAISALANQFSDGIAVSYPEVRLVRFGHLFGNESNDAVAFFSIEGFGGSNYHAEYLAIFESVPNERANGKRTHPYRLVAVSKIGGRGWRTFDWESSALKSESVTVSGKQWLDNDPGCCASDSITVTFHIKDDSIVEVK